MQCILKIRMPGIACKLAIGRETYEEMPVRLLVDQYEPGRRKYSVFAYSLRNAEISGTWEFRSGSPRGQTHAMCEIGSRGWSCDVSELKD